MTQSLVEIFTLTGLSKFEGRIVIFTAVLSVPGGILIGWSGDDLNLEGVGGAPASGVVGAPGKPSIGKVVKT